MEEKKILTDFADVRQYITAEEAYKIAAHNRRLKLEKEMGELRRKYKWIYDRIREIAHDGRMSVEIHSKELELYYLLRCDGYDVWYLESNGCECGSCDPNFTYIFKISWGNESDVLPL